MAQRAGRITCPRCGANNFDTVSVCWKCQLPLQTAAGASAYGAPQMLQQGQERAMPPAAAQVPTPSTGDFGVARRAAIWFALTLPFISLPVGWTFMMIEDHRRQAIGRICVVWSCISLIFQLLLGFIMMQSVVPYLQAIVGTATKMLPQSPGRDIGGNGSGAP